MHQGVVISISVSEASLSHTPRGVIKPCGHPCRIGVDIGQGITKEVCLQHREGPVGHVIGLVVACGVHNQTLACLQRNFAKRPRFIVFKIIRERVTSQVDGVRPVISNFNPIPVACAGFRQHDLSPHPLNGPSGHQQTEQRKPPRTSTSLHAAKVRLGDINVFVPGNRRDWQSQNHGPFSPDLRCACFAVIHILRG